MRDIKNKLTSGKNTKNIQARKGKSFGYQVLGFGAGGGTPFCSLIATGGTISEQGDFKLHTFTGPGTFTVCSVSAVNDNNMVDYIVIGGGGGGARTPPGGVGLGGAGAGGYRASSSTYDQACTPAEPVVGTPGVTVSAQGYTIVVGNGGNNGAPSPSPSTRGGTGALSSGLGVASAGGGGGANDGGGGGPGGSGGGNANGYSGGNGYGTGNVPPVSPPQGNPGGAQLNNQGPAWAASGGGGGLAAGGTQCGQNAGNGGVGGGLPSTVFGTSGVVHPSDGLYYFAGGGGGGSRANTAGTGGLGGGGNGFNPGPGPANNGTANSGGGAGGGASSPGPGISGTGGSGIVIVRYKFQ